MIMDPKRIEYIHGKLLKSLSKEEGLLLDEIVNYIPYFWKLRYEEGYTSGFNDARPD